MRFLHTRTLIVSIYLHFQQQTVQVLAELVSSLALQSSFCVPGFNEKLSLYIYPLLNFEWDYFCAMECQLFHGYHGKLSLIDKVFGPSELSLHNLWPK